MNKINVVILAAGQGKRMFSDVPKVLHKIGNMPMLLHVISTAKKLNPEKIIIVYGYGGDVVKTTINNIIASDNDNSKNNQIVWVYQDKQLGTGHALKCALPYLADKDAATLLLYGDVPLIGINTLNMMIAKYLNNIVMLTARLDNPYGYGRILRDANKQIVRVVEEKDSNKEEKLIDEINSGIYLLPNTYLPDWLNKLSNNNSQGEYYVTDIIAIAYQNGVTIESVLTKHVYEVMGINDKMQLEYLERVFQLEKANALLNQGVTILDKLRIDIRGQLLVGKDCTIDINCIFIGKVTLGDNVTIGAGSILNDVIVGNNVTIKPYSIVDGAVIGQNSQVGPFARIRPHSVLQEDAHVGNFVEIKNSTVGVNSKVNHLTYIGDTEIGNKVNVGAMSVTCNYDGKNKYKTRIKDNVFVGSGTMMVAPVTLGTGAVIGAGSVITKDTPDNELTIARAKQVTVMGWLKKRRK